MWFKRPQMFLQVFLFAPIYKACAFASAFRMAKNYRKTEANTLCILKGLAKNFVASFRHHAGNVEPLPVEFLRAVPAAPERPERHWRRVSLATSNEMNFIALVAHAVYKEPLVA